MDYQKVYDQLVQKNHTFSEGEYFETHHKVPLSLGGSDEKSNLVNLTAREHYIAHLLLVKITEQSDDMLSHRKMLYAFNCMKWGRCDGERAFKFNSRLYHRIKKQYSKLRCDIMKTENNPMRNKIWIHSVELKQNKCQDKNIQIPDGWDKGRVLNWDTYTDRMILKQNNIQVSHLTQKELQLLNEHRADEIIKERQIKRIKKHTNTQNRIRQIQEIADYYMEYGYKKTRQKYSDESITSNIVLLLKTFSYYKYKYGVIFIARNNTPGVINGSYFKKDV